MTSRKELALERVGSPFVAVTADGEPCYIQWLFSPDENERMRDVLQRRLPAAEAGRDVAGGRVHA